MRSSLVGMGLAGLAMVMACALPPTAGTFGTKQGDFYPSYRFARPDLIRTDRDVMVAQPTPTPSPGGYALPYYRKLNPETVLLNPQPLPPSPEPPELRRRLDWYLLNPQPLPPSPEPPELRRRLDWYLLNPQPLPPSPDPSPYERYRPVVPYGSN